MPKFEVDEAELQTIIAALTYWADVPHKVKGRLYMDIAQSPDGQDILGETRIHRLANKLTVPDVSALQKDIRYTVLLLYPDYMQPDGTETCLQHVTAQNVDGAIQRAQNLIVESNGMADMDPNDLLPLFVTTGWCLDYVGAQDKQYTQVGMPTKWPKLPRRPIKFEGLKGTHWCWVHAFREPKPGEFFLSGAEPEAYYSFASLSTKYWIVSPRKSAARMHLLQLEETRNDHAQ